MNSPNRILRNQRTLNLRCLRSILFAFAALCAMAGANPQVRATTIRVPGTSNPWLAGMPPGSIASFGDVAPAQSPVRVDKINLTAGSVLNFSAVGFVSNGPMGGGVTTDGPDGGELVAHYGGAENGIAGATDPINSLIGVFLDNNQPNLSAAPGEFPYSPNALTILPGLKQPFFIGDGLTGSGAIQQFTVPAGATRFYLGTMDGFSWNNNSGFFKVKVTSSGQTVPDASATFLLMLLGLLTTCGLEFLTRARA